MIYFKPTVIFLLIILVIWSGVTHYQFIQPIILPSPVAILIATYTIMFQEESLFPDISITIQRVLISLFFSGGIGIPLGLFLGYKKDIYAVVEIPIHALRSIPATALFPLLLIVIGVGELAIITLAVYPSLLIILVNTVSGVMLANERRLHQAKILGMNIWEILAELLFWEALPSILNGIRVSVSYSLVLVIAVEMFIGVGDRGLGRRIYDYQSTYQIPEAYSTIILTAIIGILLNWVVTMFEKYIMKWYSSN